MPYIAPTVYPTASQASSSQSNAGNGMGPPSWPIQIAASPGYMYSSVNAPNQYGMDPYPAPYNQPSPYMSPPPPVPNPRFPLLPEPEPVQDRSTHQCRWCERSFAHESSKCRHEKEHFNSFPCPKEGCEVVSSRKDSLKRHLRLMHADAEGSSQGSTSKNNRGGSASGRCSAWTRDRRYPISTKLTSAGSSRR